MKSRTYTFLLIIILLFLTSCSKERPCGKICSNIDQGNTTEYQNYMILQNDFREHIRFKVEMRESFGLTQRLREDVLSLSAGGQFGAYGSGFIVGWNEIKAPNSAVIPKFDIITAVSTGALLAPFVFLISGDSEYEIELINVLKRVYGNGLNDTQVFRGNILFNLINKNALFDRTPLEKLLNKELKDKYLDEIAEQYQKRFLLIGIVSLDTGQFRVVDLTWVAANHSGEIRKKIFIDTLMASSAVPIIYSPVFIDGEMFIDGGARDHVLFKKVENLITEALKLDNYLDDVDKTFYMIVHGDYAINKKCTSFAVKDIATRSMSVALDHLLRTSVFYNSYLANSFIEQKDSNKEISIWESNLKEKWNIKVKDVRGHGCSFGTTNSILFDPDFTKCLYNKGIDDGKNKNKEWITEITALSELLEDVKDTTMYPTGENYHMCKQ